jgi:hypothetical protein
MGSTDKSIRASLPERPGAYACGYIVRRGALAAASAFFDACERSAHSVRGVDGASLGRATGRRCL